MTHIYLEVTEKNRMNIVGISDEHLLLLTAPHSTDEWSGTEELSRGWGKGPGADARPGTVLF